MIFTKALKLAQDIALDTGYSSYIYLKNRDMFEIASNNKGITTLYKVDLKRKRLRNRGLSFKDLLRKNWQVQNCYGEKV